MRLYFTARAILTIDQRIGILETKLAEHHWSRQAIAGNRVALALIRDAS
jgi:hypothetical protein